MTAPPRIAVVDYGAGNLRSVAKALERSGFDVEIVADADRLRAADAVALPGVGAFSDAMGALRARGLDLAVREHIEAGRPYLGLCLGLQLLFEESEEHGLHRGLGFLPGRVRRLEVDMPIPHMGWNQLHPTRPHPMLEGVKDGEHVYFVHSYWCDAPAEVVLAETDYGARFPAIVGRGHVLGVQFHPEKSQAVGLRLMANFVRTFASAPVAAGRPA
jgi:glutamine amidotransferase